MPSQGSPTHLLKVVDGQPDLSHAVVHTSQVAPRHSKGGLGLYCLCITHLQPQRGEEKVNVGTQRQTALNAEPVSEYLFNSFFLPLDIFTLDQQMASY